MLSKDKNFQGVGGHDVIERKLAEERLRQTEEQLRLFVKYAPAAIAMLDDSMRYIQCSDRWKSDYRIAEENILGKSHYEVFPEIPQRWRDVHRRCLDGETLRSEEDSFPRADGTEDWVRWEIRPWRTSEGRVGGLLLFTEIITETVLAKRQAKSLNLQLRKAAESLERSNSELEQFAYVASHDLKEPLRMVSTYVQLLAKEYADSLKGNGVTYIHFALEGAERMYDLISDLLDYAKVGTATGKREGTDLGRLVSLVAEDLKVQIEDAGATLTWEGLPTVEVVPNLLTQVIHNLITNALKYRAPEFPRVHISAREKEREWVIAVEDNGLGIERRYWEKIFVIFQRLHTRSEYSGTGIGLALCKRIIHQHGGRIWLDSMLGKGSTFFFSLPKQPG